jgi:hypothetical protein
MSADGRESDQWRALGIAAVEQRRRPRFRPRLSYGYGRGWPVPVSRACVSAIR